MDPGLVLVENFGRMAAVFGLAAAVPLFAWGGYLWMTSMGDPNRSAAARNAVISVCVGAVIVGCCFILPRVVSEFVVAPSGGVVYESEMGVNCDALFREQLVVNRAVSIPSRMNFLVRRIQSQFEDCDAALWSPVVDDAAPRYLFLCDDSGGGSISGVPIPKGLERGSYRVSRRDAHNNIMVRFMRSAPPADGAGCWMYVSSLNTWVEGYYR